MNFIPDEDGSASVFCLIVSECLMMTFWICLQLKARRNQNIAEAACSKGPEKTHQDAARWRALSPTDM